RLPISTTISVREVGHLTLGSSLSSSDHTHGKAPLSRARLDRTAPRCSRHLFVGLRLVLIAGGLLVRTASRLSGLAAGLTRGQIPRTLHVRARSSGRHIG